MSQKNKKKGKNQKSRGNTTNRELLFAEESQLYATVEKLLGNCRLTAKCSDGLDRLCHIRGKMKRRVWIKEGSVILIGLREFEDDKADVIHCYSDDEVRPLKAYGELTEDENSTKEDQITWENNEIIDTPSKPIKLTLEQETEIQDL